MTWQNPMQRLRQRHSDKSQSVIEFRHSKWQIQVTVVRTNASSISLVESQAGHFRRSTTLGCTDDEETERGALLHGRLSSLGRILECSAQLAKKKLITMFSVPTVAACITKLTG